MITLEVQKNVRAPASKVWELITDLAGSPHVISGIESVEMLTDGKLLVAACATDR